MKDQYRIPPATFLQGSYQYLARQIQERLVIIGLLGALHGVLTVLSFLSFYALVRRGSRKDPTTIALCLALLALFVSTTTHLVTNVLFHLSNILSAIITSKSSLWSYGGYSQWSPFPSELVKDYSKAQSCATTAALTINITLGDAIVCWRACVVWHQNRPIRAVCCVLLFATFGLGVAATSLSCNRRTVIYSDSATMFATGVMYERFPAGIAACVLSLLTNLSATLLVVCKAWESRSHLRGYFACGPRAAQVEKLFALLIESGAIYSALWVAIVAFQISEYSPSGRAAGPATNGFLDIFGIVVNGALVPAIAIYPAVIIVLVALDRSHIEKAFVEHDRRVLDNFQLGPIPMGSDAAAVYLRPGHGDGNGSSLPLEPELLLVEDPGLGDGDVWGGASTSADEEQKLASIV